MKLKIYSIASYIFFVATHLVFLFVVYTYYEGGTEYRLKYLPEDVANGLLPLIIAVIVAFLVRLFKPPYFVKTFQWATIVASIVLGLFSLFAAYLAWWSTTK